MNALIKTSAENKAPMKILQVVDEVNKKQKLVIVDKILKHFNNDLKGKHFAVWGLAFKPNTDDMREAPSVVVIKKLLELGATVTAYDPAAIESAKFYLKNKINYSENEYDAVKNSDALIVITEWNEFRNPDFDLLKSLMKQSIIFDGRNIFTPEKMRELNITYFSIGRTPVNTEINVNTA